jgi:predicted acylesterase/phospholipase RssA
VIFHLSAAKTPLSVALGGGGAYGIGFHLGMTRAFEEQGIPVTSAPTIGVSAGAWAAATSAVGYGLDEVEALWRAPARRDRRGRVFVEELTQGFFGNSRDARVTAATVRLPLGSRVLIDGGRHPLSLAVAASSAPPRMAVPPRVDGRRLYDAGVLYNTCADLAAPARALLVIAPLSRGVLGLAGLECERRLWAEVSAWTVRTGGRVAVVRPSAEVVAAGAWSFSGVMDVESMRPTERAAYEQGSRIAAGVRGRLGLAAPRPALAA